jgi:hypothetical protein
MAHGELFSYFDRGPPNRRAGVGGVTLGTAAPRAGKHTPGRGSSIAPLQEHFRLSVHDAEVLLVMNKRMLPLCAKAIEGSCRFFKPHTEVLKLSNCVTLYARPRGKCRANQYVCQYLQVPAVRGSQHSHVAGGAGCGPYIGCRPTYAGTPAPKSFNSGAQKPRSKSAFYRPSYSLFLNQCTAHVHRVVLVMR